jgi:hypothetical protein
MTVNLMPSINNCKNFLSFKILYELYKKFFFKLQDHIRTLFTG